MAGWIGCEIGRDSGALAVRGPLGKSLLGLSEFAGTGMGAGGTDRGGDKGNSVGMSRVGKLGWEDMALVRSIEKS